MPERLTQQHLKRHPEKLSRFNMVHIWSGQWNAWWRESGNGYVEDIAGAGVFTAQDAWDHVKDCGPEKRISLVEAACKK